MTSFGNKWKLYTPAILFVLMMAMSDDVSAVSLGSAPGTQNLGTVYPGQSKLIDIYLLTTSTKDMLVDLSYIPIHIDYYYSNRSYFNPGESSNEDITKWIKFPENPVIVSPNKQIIHTFPSGETVNANKKVSAILSIPEDAEPGYHVGAVNFNPNYKGAGDGTTLATIAVTRFVFVFYVETGDAPRREGKITDIEAHRMNNNRVRLDVVFQNTGTDTVLVRIDNTDIFDEFGNYTGNVKSSFVEIAPKETKVISGVWADYSGIKEGDYRTVTDIDFITGKISGESMIRVQGEAVPVIEQPEASGEFPWWIVILIIIFICILIYWKI